MEKKGARRIDELGRIVIPKEIRRMFEFKEGDFVEFFTDESNIVLRKYVNSCTFCESTDNLISFRNKSICKKCISEIEVIPL